MTGSACWRSKATASCSISDTARTSWRNGCTACAGSDPNTPSRRSGGQRRRFVEAFPYGLVTGYSPSDVRRPPDPDDRHVLAAAIHGGVDILVTEDRLAFPPECVREHLSVLTADEFLNWMADRSMSLVQRTLGRQLDYYRRSLVVEDRTAVELIAYLRKAGAPRFADRLEGLFPGPTAR